METGLIMAILIGIFVLLIVAYILSVAFFIKEYNKAMEEVKHNE